MKLKSPAIWSYTYGSSTNIYLAYIIPCWRKLVKPKQELTTPILVKLKTTVFGGNFNS